MKKDLTPKDRVLLLTALVQYRLLLKERVELYTTLNDENMLKSNIEELQKANELWESTRLI